MRLHGEVNISAPREDVWRALNDPAVLKACIPGCEDLRADAENEFSATVVTKVGPISARFSGKVRLTDLDPPVSYKISGEGNGGAAGVARGEAQVALQEQNGFTVLTYSTDAKIGGKLAQIGSRMIESFAKKTADDFFQRLASRVQGGDPTAAVVTADAAPKIPDRRSAKTSAASLGLNLQRWSPSPWLAFGMALISLLGTAYLAGRMQERSEIMQLKLYRGQ